MTQTSLIRFSALSLAAVLGGGALLVSGGTAQADVEDITFDAITSAYGVEFRLTNPSIPTGIPIEGSGPTSQAELNSLPQSAAFASLPYPGDTGANITGPVKAISGLPVPDYPLYIQSSNGSPPPQSGSFPGIDLSANSTDNLSTAKAVAFTDAAGYVAESTVTQSREGAVTAASTAIQNGLQIGGVLTLSGVLSSARAELDQFGKLTMSSNLTVSRFIAPALNITLPESFQPPNSPPIPNPFKGQVLQSPDLSFTEGTFFVTIPGAGPQKYEVPEAAVVDAFKAIGVDASFQDAITTDVGVTAPILVLSSVLPAPPANQLYNGETPITYTIGRTSASITGAAVTSTDAAGTGTGGTIGADTDAGTGSAPTLDQGAAGGGTDLAGLPAGVTPLADPGLGGLPTAVGAPPASLVDTALDTVDLAPAPNRAEQFVTAQSGRELPDIAPFYFVLIAAAVLGLFGGQILAYVGVRSAWRS